MQKKTYIKWYIEHINDEEEVSLEKVSLMKIRFSIETQFKF